MAVNSFFNPFPTNITSEQNLVEDLIIESIKINGLDVFYLPRKIKTNNEIDFIYGEDTLKEYTEAYPIEMYLENIIGMNGEGDFISKFGLEIRDEISLIVSRKRFNNELKCIIRPNEGDLIYIPLFLNFFEITFVEHENNQAMFYTLGRGRGGNVFVYALKVKQFVFSNELIHTGIAEIDNQILDCYAKTRLNLLTGSGCFINNEIIYQGTSVTNYTAKAVIFNVNMTDKYMDIIQPIGSFISGTIIGNTSKATWTIDTVSELPSMINEPEDIVDNENIQLESNDILDFSSTNPFGMP